MALLHLEGFEGISPTFVTEGSNPGGDDMLDYLINNYGGLLIDPSASSQWHIRRGYDGRGQAASGASSTFGSDLWMGKSFKTIPPALTEITIGVRIKFPNTFRDNEEFLRVFPSSDSDFGEARLRTRSNNSIQINYGTTSSGFVTANDVYLDNNWHYLEWQSIFDSGSGGSYELRIDGVNVASGTGVRTSNSNNPIIAGVSLRSPAATNSSFEEQIMFDDWYILDSTGTVNNDFLGPIKIVGQPLKNVATDSDFSIFGGGDVTSNLDSTAGAVDTRGIESTNTSSNKQNYTLVPFHTGNIIGVKMQSRQQLDSGNIPIPILHTVDSDVSTSTSTQSAIFEHVNWVGHDSIFQTDPNTSAAWTKDNLNLAEFGVEVG